MSDEIKSAKGFRKIAEGRPDIVARFKAGGPGYQSRMNRALRDWLDSHTEG